MTSCSVVGCRNRFVKGGKHFFRFPRDYRFDIWVQFTRKGANFKPKQAAGICQDHFAEPFFVEKKKGRVYLLKDAVPTIFYRDTRTHESERVEVEYDPESQQYIGEESIRMLKGTISIEDEEAIIQQRSDKLKELKTLCRFCFFSKDEVKCVPLTKLEAYCIDTTEMLITIGIGPMYDEIMSSIICEKCFQHLVSIDAFKKRCRKSQDEIVAEIEEFDTKLQEVRNLRAEERPWLKREAASDDDETQRQEIQVEIIEEHLDGSAYEDIDDNDAFTNEPFDTNYGIPTEPVEEINSDFQEVIIKHETELEPKLESMENYEEPQLDNGNDSYFEQMDENQDDSDDGIEDGFLQPIKKDVSKTKDVYDVTNKKRIITNPDRNLFVYRVYECFFCQMKFAGKKTYKSHKCSVTEKACQVKECPQKFSRINLYNFHITKFHGLQKLSRQYCSMCKNVAFITETEFKQHTKECNKKALAQENFIKCEICQMKCPTLKSYTIHKLFHDSKNLVESDVTTKRRKKRLGPAICELCGKEFVSSHGLHVHRRNVHLIGSKGETYHCDICDKVRPSKRSLFNHMRNVHRVQETPCSVCGKVFRTKALVQKHMIYHTETKRIHKCYMCPDRPPYFTNVALQRHQRSHHFQEKGYACDIDNCQHAYASNHQLKVHKLNIHGIPF